MEIEAELCPPSRFSYESYPISSVSVAPSSVIISRSDRKKDSKSTSRPHIYNTFPTYRFINFYNAALSLGRATSFGPLTVCASSLCKSSSMPANPSGRTSTLFVCRSSSHSEFSEHEHQTKNRTQILTSPSSSHLPKFTYNPSPTSPLSVWNGVSPQICSSRPQGACRAV